MLSLMLLLINMLKVNLEAYNEYKDEYAKILHGLSQEFYSLFDIPSSLTSIFNIDPKTLN